MGITNDDFIRTTSEKHKKGVQKLFRTLQENDAIYLDTYTGQYCVSDEAYVEVGPGEPCPDCGRITETISESNYYFKLSEYGDRIAALIESNELLIQPDSRRNEILSFVRSGLKDLSISRTSFKWGIPVPGDEAHVIYVWLDALANYMTAVGYGSDAPEDIAKFNATGPPISTSSARRSSASTASTGPPFCWPPNCRCRSRSSPTAGSSSRTPTTKPRRCRNPWAT